MSAPLQKRLWDTGSPSILHTWNCVCEKQQDHHYLDVKLSHHIGLGPYPKAPGHPSILATKQCTMHLVKMRYSVGQESCNCIRVSPHSASRWFL